MWRHNESDGVSNHRGIDGLLNLLLRRRSNKTSKLRVTGLCRGNSPVTSEFPAQRASNAENVSIWWRHHEMIFFPSWFFHSMTKHYWLRKNQVKFYSTQWISDYCTTVINQWLLRICQLCCMRRCGLRIIAELHRDAQSSCRTATG